MNDNEQMALKVIDEVYAGQPALKNELWLHSRAVADMALECAMKRNIDINLDLLEQAALLHDLGIINTHAPSILCYGTEPYICHGIIGAEMLRARSLPIHAGVAERHTGSGLPEHDIVTQHLPLPVKDYIPLSTLERIICYADKFYSKSGELKMRKPLEKVRRQMSAFGPESLNRFESLHSQFGLDDC